MSEEKNVEIIDTSSKKHSWPPDEDKIKDIVISALDISHDKDVKVLVYWDNPTLIIFDPIHFARTDYVRKKYTCNERSIEINIGKED